MANEVQIDATGMNQMISHLRKYGKQQTRVVVRAVTGEILANAAKRTKAGSAKAVDESIAKNFRKPHEVPGVGFIGITKSGKVWANLAKFGNKDRWILLNEDGKLKNVPAQVRRTGRGSGTSKVGKDNRAAINRMVKIAKDFQGREKKYRKSLVGLSKATWYYLIDVLNLKMPANAPAKYKNMRIPPAAKAALKGFEKASSRDNYSIVIKNAVQAALNKNAKGIGAFSIAFNGKVKEFQRAASKDVRGFAKKFAARNGFEVK